MRFRIGEHGRMECGDWREVLSAGIDGEAGGAEARAAEEHAGECPECSRWLAKASALRGRMVDGVEPPADAVDAVLKALRDGGG